MSESWEALDFRRIMPDGSRRYVWTDDCKTWSVRIVDASGLLLRESLNAFVDTTEAMTWADDATRGKGTA